MSLVPKKIGSSHGICALSPLKRDSRLVAIVNKLTLNTEKTECTLVGSRQRLQVSPSNPQIVIGNHITMQVSSKKVLGVIIDEQLKWKEHNDEQCKKCQLPS